MCIYTVKRQHLKNLKKSSGAECATPPNVPKLGADLLSRGYAKLTKI